MRVLVLPEAPRDLQADDAALAETLRAEAEALGVTPRRMLLQRGRSRWPSVPAERFREVLRAQQRLTDLAGGEDTPAAGPAPLRCVALGPEGGLLVGGPRTAHLPLDGLMKRFLRVFLGPAPALPEVPLELWLGREPAVLDADWIERRTVVWNAAPLAEVHLQEPWQVYDPQRPAPFQEGRWRSPRTGDSGPCLVRVRSVRPRFLWAYLSGARLEKAWGLPPAEACALRYALDRSAPSPCRGQFAPWGHQEVALWPLSWLPTAEYILLRALSPVAPDDYRQPWVVPTTLASRVRELLSQRLGLEWEERSL